MAADERNKRHRFTNDAPGTLAELAVDHEQLFRPVPFGYQQAPPHAQLLEQRWRHLRGPGRDQDAIEGCHIAPAHRPVEGLDFDIVQAQLAHALDRPVCQVGDPLEAVDPSRKLRQYRSLIARAGADLEHTVLRFYAQELSHPRHDIRLRDGLIQADRQGMIAVGPRPHVLGYEAMPRDLQHRVENAPVPNPPLLDQLHHETPLIGILVRHSSSPSTKSFNRRCSSASPCRP